MKKLILLGLVAIGVSVGTTAKAGGFSINIALPRPCPPLFLPAPPPIIVPPPVGLVACAPRVIVTPDCYWDARARCYVPRERVVVRDFDRDRFRDHDRDRDRHFGHDRR